MNQYKRKNNENMNKVNKVTNTKEIKEIYIETLHQKLRKLISEKIIVSMKENICKAQMKVALPFIIKEVIELFLIKMMMKYLIVMLINQSRI